MPALPGEQTMTTKPDTTKQEQSLLSDHVDTRPVMADEEVADRNTIVQLDPDRAEAPKL